MTAEEIVECVRRMEQSARIAVMEMQVALNGGDPFANVAAWHARKSAHEARRLLRLTGQLEAE